MINLLLVLVLLFSPSIVYSYTTDGLGHAETTGLGSGGSGVTLTGSTWSVSGGKAVNTPTLGAEILSDTGFDTACGVNWGCQAAWSISGGKAVATAAGGSLIYENRAGTLDVWYNFGATTTASSGYGQFYLHGVSTFPLWSAVGPASYVGTKRSTAGSPLVAAVFNGTGTVDYISLKSISLPSLFLTAPLSTANVFASADLTVTAGTQSGLVLNLDSASNPQNFVIGYTDNGTCYLEKNVGGTYTNLINTATGCTYSAGASMKAWKDGTAYRLYYNNAFIGSQQTVSDAGIKDNKLHGLFSTSDQNSTDNLVIYPTGTDGEYSILNKFIN
jgi:hypothetical protein